MALLIFMLAGISDGLDGYLARRFHWISQLGSYLDPMADKLIMTASYFMLGWLAQLPMWLVMIVIGRDLIIVSGAFAYRIVVEEITMQPLRISKLNTALQILLVVLMIYKLSGLPFSNVVSPMFLAWLMYMVLFTTLTSGLMYVVVWTLRARSELKQENHS